MFPRVLHRHRCAGAAPARRRGPRWRRDVAVPENHRTQARPRRRSAHAHGPRYPVVLEVGTRAHCTNAGGPPKSINSTTSRVIAITQPSYWHFLFPGVAIVTIVSIYPFLEFGVDEATYACSALLK